MSDETGQLIQRTKAKDFQALARLLSVLERGGPRLLGQFPELLTPAKPSFRIGITGPPGAGKSTLINQLIKEFRQMGQRVGVIAVDPSSPFSHGAILGDRIRYQEHFNDPNVFIRSLGTRGSLGGLSASAYLMVRAFDLAAFDVVLIETVGVGQTELEVINVADFIAVVLVPESGDSVQAMKAGLLEIADLYVVNKADRPGAQVFLNELQATLQLGESTHAAKLLATIATEGDGVKEFIACVREASSQEKWRLRRQSVERIRNEARALLRLEFEQKIDAQVAHVATSSDLATLFSLVIT